MNISGIEVIESHLMVKPGPPAQMKRTWRERLFSRPWTPRVKFKTYIPMVPRDDIFKTPSGALIMHPAIAEKLRKEFKAL